MNKSVEKWRHDVEAMRLAVNEVEAPVDFLLGWIQVESDGNVGTISSINERGLFQIHPEEAKTLGLSDEDFSKVAKEPALSLQHGIRLVSYYKAKAKKWLSQNNTTLTGWDFWRYVKLYHALPVVAKELPVKVAAKLGRPARNWDELALNGRSMQTSKELSDYGNRQASRILANAEKVVNIALGAKTPGGGSVSPPPSERKL